MKTFLAFSPALLTVVYIWLLGTRRAFLDIYLPLLLLVPTAFHTDIVGLPDLSISESSLVVIVVFAFASALTCRLSAFFQFRMGDLCVWSFIVWASFAQYVNTHEINKEWQTVLSSRVVGIALPYYAAFFLFTEREFRGLFVKRMALLCILAALVSVYEWRMSVNLFEVCFEKIFPREGFRNLNFRAGWVRITGPFSHPILFGLMFGVAILSVFWIKKGKILSREPSYIFPLPFHQVWVYIALLTAGLVFTLSRAPLIAVFLGVVCFLVGSSSYRALGAAFGGVAFTLVGFFGYQYYYELATMNRDLISTHLDSAALYRIELFDFYKGFIAEKPWFGWGHRTETWPEMEEFYRSVDNHFLWMSMQFGVFATIVQLIPFVWYGLRLFLIGIFANVSSFERQEAVFLFSLLFLFGASLVTVYLGGQMTAVFYLFIGWIQRFLEERRPSDAPITTLA